MIFIFIDHVLDQLHGKKNSYEFRSFIKIDCSSSKRSHRHENGERDQRR